MAGRILIHLPRHMAQELSDGRPHYYTRLRAELAARGAAAEIVIRAPGNPAPDPQDGNFHFLHQAGHRQANVLNTGAAYITPFWYADPAGIYGDSSLVARTFDPAQVDGVAAWGFRQRLHRRLVLPRQSRYTQRAEVTALPEGAIAVFLQGPSDILDRARHMSTAAMIRAVAAARGDRPVIVKPHPKGIEPGTARILRKLEAAGKLQVSEANLHDILSAAAVMVTISSAVALESMIHHKPVVLCGRSDLHHCAATARRPEDIA
ncbi:hypothetical protein FGG78_32065, partial [Thioclava sp. BHET1]